MYEKLEEIRELEERTMSVISSMEFIENEEEGEYELKELFQDMFYQARQKIYDMYEPPIYKIIS